MEGKSRNRSPEQVAARSWSSKGWLNMGNALNCGREWKGRHDNNVTVLNLRHKHPVILGGLVLASRVRG